MSYAHEDKELATRLAAGLRSRGCRVWIDDEGMRIGDRLLERIADAIADVEFLLAIVSPASVNSAWCRRELSMAMTNELEKAHVKVLPVRLGPTPLPATLKDVFAPHIDPDDIDTTADRLVAAMDSHLGGRKARPSEGAKPTPTVVPTAPPNPPPAHTEDPVRILGIDVEHVGRPRNDGTAGSALYKVPLRLNRRPSSAWAMTFPAIWDHPPRFTTMHRPGIASVSGDRIVLDGTTVDEIEKYHAETLRLVIQEANKRVDALETEQRASREREVAKQREHDEAVREAATRLTFD